MSEYTPTTEEVREYYCLDRGGTVNADWYAEFDRWLAQHDQEVREKVAKEIENADASTPGSCALTGDDQCSCDQAAAIARGEFK